jgi:hypothetical protein
MRTHCRVHQVLDPVYLVAKFADWLEVIGTAHLGQRINYRRLDKRRSSVKRNSSAISQSHIDRPCQLTKPYLELYCTSFHLSHDSSLVTYGFDDLIQVVRHTDVYSQPSKKSATATLFQTTSLSFNFQEVKRVRGYPSV